MMIKLRYTITFHNMAKNLERYYQNVLNSTFSIWQKGAHFVSNFLLFAIYGLRICRLLTLCAPQNAGEIGLILKKCLHYDFMILLF